MARPKKKTAHFFRFKVNPTEVSENMKTEATFDPYTIKEFGTFVRTCIPLSFAVNSINRAMGITDAYPFVITPVVIKKMTFIHQLLLPKR